MKKRLAITGAVLIGAGAAIYGFLSPSFLQWRVERACPQVTDADCAARTRALAHIFALNGNTERAMHWYRRSAASGDARSQFHLAWMIEQKALDTFQSAAFVAAAAGNTSDARNAQFEFEAAADLYRRAAAKGFAPAMNNLGQVYARGLASGSNPQMAAYYYRMAAEAGNPVGGFNLAMSGQSDSERWIEWSPARKFDKADLAQPTLERTRIMGGMLVEDMRLRLRAAAAAASPGSVKLELRPLRSVAGLPTFEQVRRQSYGPTRDPFR